VPVLGIVLSVIAGYLVGAVPSGVIVGRLRGTDPRSGGSGRTGATNAMRTLGTGLAVVVLLADVLKGVAAVLLGGWIAEGLGASAMWGAALGGLAAVIGHVRSVFIGFTGGRGVATGGGAMLVLAPVAIIAAVPVLVVAIWRTRYVSLGSILAAATVAVAAVVLHLLGEASLGAAVAAAGIGAVVILAHADNIERLRAGTERRLGSG
jgi:acyl phosphate:glycerol-3-phosphate acyltransferase